MKRLSYFCVMAFFALICFSSCQESTEKKDKVIAYKIESNEALSPEDYTRMIEYVGEYAEKAQQYVVGDSQEDSENLAKLAQEYPLLDTFRNCIGMTPLAKFSDTDKELIAKYAGLVMFTPPMGYTLQTDPEAAGLEVATPDSANGVIAGAVDSLELKR